MLARMWKQQSSHALLVGARNGTVPVELACRTERLCIFSSISKYMSDRNVCIFLPKDLRINVHSSAILRGPKLEVTATPTNGFMNQ